ncbi:hypothetical protein KSP40_PGU017102 [Platanthera guangdongensis]|uniref:Uncharacterized protein n=1 Tax=Platanthera guangdongensis TaxID=2320717 RepID=A0ABR2M4T1_9ASPA
MEIRRRAAEWKEKAAEAVADDGPEAATHHQNQQKIPLPDTGEATKTKNQHSGLQNRLTVVRRTAHRKPCNQSATGEAVTERPENAAGVAAREAAEEATRETMTERPGAAAGAVVVPHPMSNDHVNLGPLFIIDPEHIGFGLPNRSTVAAIWQQRGSQARPHLRPAGLDPSGRFFLRAARGPVCLDPVRRVLYKRGPINGCISWFISLRRSLS